MLIFVQNSWPGPRVQQKPQNLQASSNGKVLFNCPLVQELSSWVSGRNYYANEPLQLATYQVRLQIYSLLLDFFKWKMKSSKPMCLRFESPVDWLIGDLAFRPLDGLIDWLICFVLFHFPPFLPGLSNFYAASSQPLPVFIHRSHVAGE